VAHEERNPLSAIKAAAQYLAGRHQDDLTGRFLAMIEEEADRLARFTSSLLAYARPRQVSHQPLQLARLVGQAWEAVAGQAHKAGVSLTFLPGPDLPPVAGEPELVRAAIANVLLNAVQAMASGGEVVVRLQAGADRVRVVVTDQGPGLPPGLRRLVWEPFFTTKRQGSGLGLALVKKIIDLHGGQVHIGSRPGRGTTVVLALPAGPLAR